MRDADIATDDWPGRPKAPDSKGRMPNVNDTPALMTHLSKISKPRIRFFLADDPEPTAWGRWLTAPVNGYLEHEAFGPFPASQAKRCQILVDRESPQAIDQLLEAGFVEVNEGLFEKSDVE